ncbi:MAG: PP2C family protein-serine/threonine phosphatase [Candidatus Oleimicrobiaceae bacterium]
MHAGSNFFRNGRFPRWDSSQQRDLARGLREELRDIYYFYVDPERRQELENKHRLVRWVYVVIWIGTSMLAKLTPLRRFLLLMSLAMVLIHMRYSVNGNEVLSIDLRGLGFVLLLVVLLLELKDKLLFQDELVAGRAVQEALLPKESPMLAGWDIWLHTRPANEVGGDLVDYVPLAHGRLAICLGDVAGKGLGAALCMAKVQATIRALADFIPSLSRLGRRLNEILCRDGLPQRFVSLIVASVGSRSGRVHMLNAGHLPPLLLRDGQCQELPRGEAALGLTPKTRFRVHSVSLAKGDVLFIYSDGLTECRDQHHELFGEQRLSNVLAEASPGSARQIGEQVVSAVEHFVGQARFEDDFSLAVLKRTA